MGAIAIVLAAMYILRLISAVLHQSPGPSVTEHALDLRPGEPLDMRDVRLERVDPADEPADARQILDALEELADACARRLSQQPARVREEELLPRVARRRWRMIEEERRRQQAHVVSTLAESRSESVVVGRRVAKRIDERDLHARPRVSVTVTGVSVGSRRWRAQA